jgi:hypothetical protein
MEMCVYVSELPKNKKGKVSKPINHSMNNTAQQAVIPPSTQSLQCSLIKQDSLLLIAAAVYKVVATMETNVKQ